MTIEAGRPADDEPLAPEDVDSAPVLANDQPNQDPNDEIPVPIAMTPAEVDERAQVVEKLRHETADSVEPLPPSA